MTMFAIVDEHDVIQEVVDAPSIDKVAAVFNVAQDRVRFCPEGAARGGKLSSDGNYDPPPLEPSPVPQEISRPQMIMALRFLDKITEPEAIDAMTIGAVPAAVQAVFDTMSPTNKFTATVRWAGASVIERDNPIVLALAASDGMSETELDDFFRFAVTL